MRLMSACVVRLHGVHTQLSNEWSLQSTSNVDARVHTPHSP